MAELQENANKALEELLATKASIDACRQTAIWELGIELCWNESETTESIKEARAICFCVTLDAKALCFTVIKEAKTTQACTIWEVEAACSMAIRDAETWRASKAELLHRQHGKVMQDLEEQVIQEEGRSQTDFLSTCQAALCASLAELKGVLAASYQILLGQTPTSHPFTYHKGPHQWRNSLLQQLLLHQCPSSPPRPKRQHPSQILWTAHLQAELHPRQPQKSPPAPNSERSHLGTRCSSRAAWKHSAGTLTW